MAGPTDPVNPDVIDGGSLGDAVVYTIRQGCFSAGPTDPVNPDVIDGGSLGDAVVYTIRQGCFSYADMLPIKVFMSILYGIVMKSQV